MKKSHMLLIALAVLLGFFARDFFGKNDATHEESSPPSIQDHPEQEKVEPKKEFMVPLCSDDMKSQIEETMQQQLPQFKILEFYPNYEIFYDEKNKSRECVAGIASSTGEISVWYKIRENKSAKGDYIFQVKQVNFDANLLAPVPLNDDQIKMLQGRWARKDMILNIGVDYTKIDSIGDQKQSTVCRNIKYDTALVLGYCHINGVYKELDAMCNDRSCPAIDTVKLKKRSDGLRFMLPGVWEESWDDEDKGEDAELIFKKETTESNNDYLKKDIIPENISIKDMAVQSGFLTSNVQALKSIESGRKDDKFAIKNGQEVIINGQSTVGDLYRVKIKEDAEEYYYIPKSSVALFSE